MNEWVEYVNIFESDNDTMLTIFCLICDRIYNKGSEYLIYWIGNKIPLDNKYIYIDPMFI